MLQNKELMEKCRTIIPFNERERETETETEREREMERETEREIFSHRQGKNELQFSITRGDNFLSVIVFLFTT